MEILKYGREYILSFCVYFVIFYFLGHNTRAFFYRYTAYFTNFMKDNFSILFTRFPLKSAWGGEEAVHLEMAKHWDKIHIKPVFCGSCSVLGDAFLQHHFFTIFFPFFKDITSRKQIFITPILLPFFFLVGIGVLFAFRIKGVRKMLCMTFLEKICWTPIAKILGIQVFWGHHAPLGDWFFKNPFLFLWKFCASWATIIVPSEYMKNQIQSNISKPLHIQVLPNPILPHNNLHTDEQKISGIHFQKTVIGTASRFSPEKGLPDALEAFTLLSTSEYTLIMAGDGPLQADLQQKNIPNAFFLGFCTAPQMQAFWEKIDIFVLPSYEEPFGMVLLEAMQAGVPIIATRVGGIREVLGEAGILVPPKSPKAIADAIIDLSHNPEKVEHLRNIGKKRVQEHFSYEQFLKNADHIFFNF